MAKSEQTPGERADQLHALGYKCRRTSTFGVYTLKKPDGTRYTVNCVNWHCSCPASVTCKHLMFVQWAWTFDQAKADLEAARARNFMVEMYETAFWAARFHLRRIARMKA